MADMVGSMTKTLAAKMTKKPPLGSGARFAALKGKLAKQGVRDPAALAASIGRKSLGKARFQQLAAQGRKRAK